VGHAAHFLRRLDRLSDPHVELALTLYNDPELLGATLARAKLPEGAARLAITLDHPNLGPFVVVTREGRFVTCLGSGMHPGDLPVITREQLDAAARQVERMREAIAQSRFFDGNQGLLRKKVDALYRDAEHVSREQIEDLARWTPLLGSAYLLACTGTGTDLLDVRGRVKNVRRPHPRHEALLRHYHSTLYAMAHLYVLAGMSPQTRESLAALLPQSAAFTWAWAGLRHDNSYVLYRALWSTGRLGKPLFPGQKHRLRGELTYFGMADAVLGTAMIGLAHDKLRAEARKALAAPRDPMTVDPRIAPFGDVLDHVVDLAFEHPEEADVVALHLGRQLLMTNREKLPERYRWDAAEDVPEDLARAALIYVPQRMLTEPEMLACFLHMLPWLARAQAGELYLPQDFIDAVRTPWTMEETIAQLEGLREEEGVPTPVKSERTPGRNDPCSCGSGKKYKRCCGR
jgi:uncharacterized protein YchJ